MPTLYRVSAGTKEQDQEANYKKQYLLLEIFEPPILRIATEIDFFILYAVWEAVLSLAERLCLAPAALETSHRHQQA
jgi:hypothetical protein